MATIAMTHSGANTPGEHFQLAAFTAAAAVLVIWLGRRQRRTGRSFIFTDKAVRIGGTLIQPPPPSRWNRAIGCIGIGVGGFFILSAVVNLAMALHGLLT
ncbi:hypothetical protein G3I71_02410 [Streptomyces sp. SID12501]|uniref:Uncharacterized protein n=1 Tax=Streptomyces sp. SID12501 TaxID=2706042 RepID=A0A6B3BG15_9ACTN|nr:hypothetical protein [Streptomyces sp. SID12501]